jgi:hypothetical protein
VFGLIRFVQALSFLIILIKSEKVFKIYKVKKNDYLPFIHRIKEISDGNLKDICFSQSQILKIKQQYPKVLSRNKLTLVFTQRKNKFFIVNIYSKKNEKKIKMKLNLLTEGKKIHDECFILFKQKDKF